jgi:hypothetical protein
MTRLCHLDLEIITSFAWRSFLSWRAMLWNFTLLLSFDDLRASSTPPVISGNVMYHSTALLKSPESSLLMSSMSLRLYFSKYRFAIVWIATLLFPPITQHTLAYHMNEWIWKLSNRPHPVASNWESAIIVSLYVELSCFRIFCFVCMLWWALSEQFVKAW